MNRMFVLRDQIALKQLGAFLSANWLAMAQAGKPLSISVAEYKRKRNTDQNALLHVLLSNIADNAWINGKQYSAEVWKESLKRRFIGVEEIALPDGAIIERGISTTALSVPDFAEFIDKIQHFAVDELGITP